MTKKVAVIGAGAAGLPSIRHALLYGFDVVCYEAQDDIGGLWRYRQEETPDACVMKSTVINTSKELTAYSDFPPPAEQANFMHNTHMHAYLRDYAHHHNLLPYIKLQHKVLNVERASDYAKSGKWKVTVKDLKTEVVSSDVYDGVLLCAGHHAVPHLPPAWPGQGGFKGEVIHAHAYKDHKGFEDKTVVVVGVGNSGGDVAVELSRIAKQVYLVTRRGTWILNRVGHCGQPFDCSYNSRAFELLKQVVPKWLLEKAWHGHLNNRFDHAQFGLQAKHGFWGAHPTINDELPNRISSGTVRVRPQIKKFGVHSVEFIDGSVADHVDSVILATGYTIGFPVVEGGNHIKVAENEVDLFEYVFPNDCAHDTLAIIGLIQPVGSIMPIAEMQARVALDVIDGSSRLPSQEQRRANTAAKKEAMAGRYVKSRRHTIQVDYIPYMDELAALIGCLPPSFSSLLLSDPSLAAHSLLGPQAAYYYRLRGPHPWRGAREAILGIEDRVVKATNSSMNGRLLTIKNGSVAVLLEWITYGFGCILLVALFIYLALC